VPVGARLLIVSRPESAARLLLRILAGLARPAAGTISLAGLTRSGESAAGWGRRVGHVGAEPSIYPWLSPQEALSLAARLAGLDRQERELRVETALDHFHMRADARRPIGRAGPIVAQKTALAAALLSEPEVLLLDEPLRSLDPLERRRLLKLPGRRLTVLLASRYPASEEGLVNQVAMVRGGRVALHAMVGDLAANGLPLSARGIEALADLPAAGNGRVPGGPAAGTVAAEAAR
jgi:ABC-2 type transport system ATP-binding protein